MPRILGFTAHSSAKRTGVRTYRVPSTDVSLPVKAEVAPLLIGLAAEFHRDVEPLVKGWCWGWAYRLIRDALRLSKHGAGIAIDLNAPRHPLGRRNTFPPAARARCRALARKYGCVWGGDWKRPDDMHFEIAVSRDRALELVGKLQTPPAPPAARPPARRKQYLTLREGAGITDTRPQIVGLVKDAQRALAKDGWKVAPDGRFGPGMAAAVRACQRKHRLVADGVIGPGTWALLRRIAH